MRSFVASSAACLAAVYGSANAEFFGTYKNIPSESYLKVETDPTGVTWPWITYKTSNYTPPNMTITGNGKPLAEGLLFLTQLDPGTNGAKQCANYIIDSDSNLVFGSNLPSGTDYRKQYYNGQPYLTYWEGNQTVGPNTGHGWGNVTFLDQEYKPFYLSPKLNINALVPDSISGGKVDIHEHQMTNRNTMLVTSFNDTPADLTSVGGLKDGWVATTLVYELDIATGEVVFEWNIQDYIPFSKSHLKLTNVTGTKEAPWDWVHINSAQMVGENYLINSRHLWSMFLVNPAGEILWEFNGEDGGDFAAPPANATFRWEHYVRGHNYTENSIDISIFDNNNGNPPYNGSGQTKQLVFHLELPPSKDKPTINTRRIVTEDDPVYVDSQGSYIPELSNGNQFVGYGMVAMFREYGPGPNGDDLRYQAVFGKYIQVFNYRGFKQVWNATPAAWDPVLMVENNTAYVSWNGATDVKSWNIYGGKYSPFFMEPIGNAIKKGFETMFQVPSGYQFLQIGAVQHGQEVRFSNLLEM